MATTVYKKTDALRDVSTSFCPGCSHGIVGNLLGTCIDELKLNADAVLVAGVGCSGMFTQFWNTDSVYSLHGRAPASATGIKRLNPDSIVITYQGDGDLASIGMAEIVHAANRGEKITVIFVNNSNYGMTGGQMSPTTLIGQKTTTSPNGRTAEHSGMPMKVCEMLSALGGVKYLERVTVDTPANCRKAKKAIKRALECQRRGLGFSMVEVLAICPTNWGKTPSAANQWLRENMLPYYPLGNFKDYK